MLADAGDCQERLAEHGYEHYEVSAYARRGRQCRHNLNYWEFGDYLGVGAGAHGKLTWLRAQSESCGRRARKQPREYLGRAPRRLQRSLLVRPRLPFEYLLNLLRLVDGFAEALRSADRTRR